MLAPLVRDMIAAELPVLETHGLSMWGYSVLVALDRSAIRTQAALADAIGLPVGTRVDEPAWLARARRV